MTKPYLTVAAMPTVVAATAAALRAGESAHFVAGEFARVGALTGSLLTWDAASTATDNGTTVIKPDDLGIGDPGRWVKPVELIVGGIARADAYSGPVGGDVVVAAPAGDVNVQVASGHKVVVGDGATIAEFERSDEESGLVPWLSFGTGGGFKADTALVFSTGSGGASLLAQGGNVGVTAKSSGDIGLNLGVARAVVVSDGGNEVLTFGNDGGLPAIRARNAGLDDYVTMVRRTGDDGVEVAGFVRYVRPAGGGTDDAPRIHDALNATAYSGKVVAVGIFDMQTPCQLVRGGRLESAVGSEFQSSISPSMGGHQNSVFTYDEFSSPLESLVLDVDAIEGLTMITLTAIGSVVAGSEIAIQDSTSPNNQVAAYVVRDVSGTDVFLDRPLLHTFPNGSNVYRYLRAKDITLIGNGAKISGTGDRAISVVSAWNCYVEGWDIDARDMDTEYAFSFDTGSYNSSYNLMTVRSGDATALAMEACENCWGYNARVVSEANDNAAFLFQAAYNSGLINCHASGRTAGSGAGLLVGFVTDTVASRGIKIIGCSFDKNLHGIDISGSSHDVEIVGCDLSYNTQHGLRVVKQSSSLLPGRTRVFGGTIKQNGYEGCNFDGTVGNRLIGVYTEENGTSGHAGAFITSNGAELFASKCEFVESVSTPGMKITGSDSVILSDCRIRSTNAGFWYAVWVAGTASVSCKGLRFDIANGNGTCILMNAAGVLYLEDCVNDGANIANGVQASAGSVRMGARTAFNNTSTPYSFTSTGHGSFGTVTLNGATPVDYTFADVQAGEPVDLVRMTAGGTPGFAPTYTITAGSKVSVTGTAGDTSVYTIRIG